VDWSPVIHGATERSLDAHSRKDAADGTLWPNGGVNSRSSLFTLGVVVVVVMVVVVNVVVVVVLSASLSLSSSLSAAAA